MKRLFLLIFIVSFVPLLLMTTIACGIKIRPLSLSEESYKKIKEFNSKFQFQLKSRIFSIENDSNQEKIKTKLKEKIIYTFKDINKNEANNRFNLDENINFQIFIDKNKININNYKINMARLPEYKLEFTYKDLEYKLKKNSNN